MNFLYNKNSQFNLANLITFGNISFGIIAIYFITQDIFLWAAIFAWFGGAFDIFDGKIARKYNLSNEFGVQLDSFADFLSFVLVPVFLIFQAVYITSLNGISIFIASVASIYYVISGLRRLIHFNLNTDAGSVDRYFTGVPTPLGAILLWVVYLLWNFGLIPTIFDIPNQYFVLTLMIIIGYLLNSKIKIPHP